VLPPKFRRSGMSIAVASTEWMRMRWGQVLHSDIFVARDDSPLTGKMSECKT
jgi:hypothetical protein